MFFTLRNKIERERDKRLIWPLKFCDCFPMLPVKLIFALTSLFICAMMNCLGNTNKLTENVLIYKVVKLILVKLIVSVDACSVLSIFLIGSAISSIIKSY